MFNRCCFNSCIHHYVTKSMVYQYMNHTMVVILTYRFLLFNLIWTATPLPTQAHTLPVPIHKPLLKPQTDNKSPSNKSLKPNW